MSDDFWPTYIVTVRQAGRNISDHSMTAANALAAINLVETIYGDEPEVKWRTIQHSDGTSEKILVVLGWHGYTFEARTLKMELS